MNSNEFYQAFVAYYDDFFPTDPGVTEFLCSIKKSVDTLHATHHSIGSSGKGALTAPDKLSPSNEIGQKNNNLVDTFLDLGCGTGGYVRALREAGIAAWGTDLSPEMIARGIELMRGGTAEPGPWNGRNRIDTQQSESAEILSVGDLRSAQAHPAAPFDLVYSIGNTIAHLSSAAEVAEWIGTLPAILRRPHGTVVVQFVDLAHLPVGSDRELPILGGGAPRERSSANGDRNGTVHTPEATRHATMQRRYTRVSPERYRMDATITVDDRSSGTAGEITVSQMLLVLETDRMIDAFRSAGFDSVSAFGGFSRERPVNPDSWVRVVEARLS